MKHRLFLPLWLLILPCRMFAADTLDIYWIDVEGGAATLIVTPAGETVLVDAGWAGLGDRDANRIKDVLTSEAKASKIDYFITSHFHGDHAGGLPGLAETVPIAKFVDHGDSVEQHRERGKKIWESYLKVAQGERMTVKPGDKLPLQGAALTFVAAHSKFIDRPLRPGGPNPHCKDARLKEVDQGENGKSVGFIVGMGDFEFLDLGDLSWNFEHELACPENLLGEIDLYQVTHHGSSGSVPPQHVWAIRPKVAVMNNGPRKGGSSEVYEVLMKSPELEDLWQVHRAMENDERHNTGENKIANLTETDTCQGHWIKASVRSDGAFTVTNSRNGYTKTYRAR